jgi:hypothetical protein
VARRALRLDGGPATTTPSNMSLGLCQQFAQQHAPRPHSYCPPRQKPLYLLAGQGKTGSSSLSHALTMLGLVTAHYACAKRCNSTAWCEANRVVVDGPLTRDYIHQRIKLEELPKKSYSTTTSFCFDDRYDAVADTPMAEFAPYIYQMHRPGDVKVVLSVKDPVEWLAKRTDHSAKDHGTDGLDAAPFALAFLGGVGSTLKRSEMPAWATVASVHARAPIAGAYLSLAQQLLIMCMVRPRDLLVVDVAEESRNTTALWHRLAAFTNRSLVALHRRECAAPNLTAQCNLAAHPLPHISGPFCRKVVSDSELAGEHQPRLAKVPPKSGSSLARPKSGSGLAPRPAMPRMVLCTLFTLRYEAPYILPWIAHHRLLGVDRVILYHDDASGFWSPAFATDHAKLLSILQDEEHSGWLTFHSMAALNISTQMEQLQHCNREAQTLKATWVGNWDMDEHLYSSRPTTNTVDKLGWLKLLPEDVQAAVIPRVEMCEAPMPVLPPDNRLVYQAFTHHLSQHVLGKTIWRPGNNIRHTNEGGHMLSLSGSLREALRCSYSYQTKGSYGQQLNWTTTLLRKPALSCEINRSHLVGLASMRVYHFRHISTSECMLKVQLAKSYTATNGWNIPGVVNGHFTNHYTAAGCHHQHERCEVQISSLKQNTASILAFIQDAFVDGLAILGAEQARHYRKLDLFWKGLTSAVPAPAPSTKGKVTPAVKPKAAVTKANAKEKVATPTKKRAPPKQRS